MKLGMNDVATRNKALDIRERAGLGIIPGAWVRVFRDGTTWAGVHESNLACLGKVKALLERAGYVCECNGKPGTSGEHIIDVKINRQTVETKC